MEHEHVMITIAVQELTGRALDWAVSTARKATPRKDHFSHGVTWHGWHELTPAGNASSEYRPLPCYLQSPHDLVQLIEEACIAIRKHKKSGKWFAMTSADLGDSRSALWSERAMAGGSQYGAQGLGVNLRRQRFESKSMPEAVLRCFVAQALGDEIEIPEELATEMETAQ